MWAEAADPAHGRPARGGGAAQCGTDLADEMEESGGVNFFKKEFIVDRRNQMPRSQMERKQIIKRLREGAKRKDIADEFAVSLQWISALSKKLKTRVRGS